MVAQGESLIKERFAGRSWSGVEFLNNCNNPCLEEQPASYWFLFPSDQTVTLAELRSIFC